MAAQATALPDLPLALRRSQKARMIGLCFQATKAGMNKTLRRRASPTFERRVWIALPD